MRSDHSALGSPLGAAVGGGLALAVQRAVAVAPHAVARRAVRRDVNERLDVRAAACLDHRGRAIDVEPVDALVVPRARARVHDACGVNDRCRAAQRERQLIWITHVGEAHLRTASVSRSVQVDDDHGIELAEARVHYVPAYEAAAAYDGAAARGWHARTIHFRRERRDGETSCPAQLSQ